MCRSMANARSVNIDHTFIKHYRTILLNCQMFDVGRLR